VDQRTPSKPAPRFSIISAVYNVEKYLGDFIDSIEAQDFPLDELEVIMVNDGSPDSSAQILAEWQERRPDLVTVVTQPNGGLPNARNGGLDHVHGEWLTFIDPDDTIAPSYFSEVDAMLRKNPRVQIASTRRILMFDASGEVRPHGLDVMYGKANRVRDLNEHPDFFVGHAPSTFVRTEVLRRTGLRFGEQVRPNWEDGHFCVHYLMRVDRPLAAFVTTAEYFYRKRADETSVLSKSQLDPGRYTTVLEYGYLDVLEQARERYGRVPDWLQTYILYELSWYFSTQEGFANMPSMAFGETAVKMHGLMTRIVGLLDPAVIESFRLRPFSPRWREVLLHSYSDVPWHTDFALVDKIDTDQRLVRVSYRYVGPPPREEFYSEGALVEPAFAKTRSIIYFDRTMLHERIVWLPSGAVRVKLDGADVDVRLEEPEPPRYTLRLWNIRNTLVPEQAVETEKRERKQAKRRKLRDRLTLAVSRSRLVKRFFADAWVLIDRVENADDSAELLFRHLRQRRRKINAWFVVQKGTPDYRRLRKDGYKRVIPYGSLRWKLLMLNCHHLVSSHADGPIVRPAQLARMLPAPTWRFAFLNHGVIKDDLSRWLDPKDMDLFVTSTRGEYESVAGEGSPYRYGDRETVLTGMPRFDAVLEAGNRVLPEQRDLILLAPTWRNWLVLRHLKPGESTIDMDVFTASEFATSWLGLARSPELEALARKHGLKVALLLHPNMQRISSQLSVPDHVEVLTWDGQDVRGVFARARVLVTDYSSMAFNAAYIERPVVYFQFDRDRVLTGAHLGRRGYFDYETLGYGPVRETFDEALQAIAETVDYGPHPMPEYLDRIHEAFPDRDGECTERVAKAIIKSARKVRRKGSAPDEDEAPADPNAMNEAREYDPDDTSDFETP
jgi:glycosyltransferase involved in cell wall biosynthesis